MRDVFGEVRTGHWENLRYQTKILGESEVEDNQSTVAKALPGLRSQDGSTGQPSTGTRGTLVTVGSDAKVPAATRIRQQRKAGRSMSKRSGQSGSVCLVGSKWYGRYWRDVPGKEKREHPSVILGEKSSMTKPEARRKLMDIIEAEGVNKPQHLERALKPVVTFNSIADAWEAKRLPLLHNSSQVVTLGHIRRHVRPLFQQHSFRRDSHRH